MNKYILTSTNFPGQVTYGFNAEGQLIYYCNEAQMTMEQVDAALRFLPRHVTALNALKTATATLVELPPDITWDRFWGAYDQKINAKRCKPLWEAASDIDKLMAIVRISHYKAYCKHKNIGQANPEKYLRDRYFDTDWLKIK